MSNDGTAVIQHDPYLAPYASFFRARYSSLQLLLKEINLKEGSLEQFTSAYKRMGFSVNEKGITFREYAPAAKAISLIGDFNNWDRSHTNYNLTKRDFGMWDIFIPRNEDGSLPIPHDSKIKLSMIIEDGRKVDRIPVWIRRVLQELDTANFDGIFWWPNEEYQWKFDQNRPIIKTFTEENSLPRSDHFNNGNGHNENDNISNLIKIDQLSLSLSSPSSSSPLSDSNSNSNCNSSSPSSSSPSSSSSSLLLSPSPFLSEPMMEKRSKEDFEEEEKRKTNISKEFERLRIYEAHIGMSSEQPVISTYKKFKEEVLPHVYKLGYNCIQLMGIMEHSYYASFGYQVTNLFAVSSRYGSPDDLKELIDEAHRLNIIVLLDVVHSHVSKNVDDGINQFDGTTYCYFHEGERGYHPLWDSRLYNYRHWEVLRLLLSNLRFYIEEFHFDGFRFDGVTSMLYQHHGLSQSFAGGYDDYFSDSIIDHDAALYLTLANELLHSFYKNIITIAEDVSGFPSLCRPVAEGGMGFDYRLAMAIPDLWIKLLKEFKDEDWPLGHICYTLINRRHLEKSIAYAESHDQSLVGDKTIAFWLMDKYMYTDMSTLFSLHPIIDRGISLHKLIRLITYSLGGEGYLNFMGNEFGHPEWIDFPRAGNNNSCFYARRQWSLVKDPLLRYQYLYNFDCAMHSLEKLSKWLSSEQAYISYCSDNQKITIFERGNLLWAFNFHPTESYVNFRIPVKVAGKYKIILDSDETRFGGHNRIDHSIEFFTDPFSYSHFNNSMLTYLPSRCAIVWFNADLFSFPPL